MTSPFKETDLLETNRDAIFTTWDNTFTNGTYKQLSIEEFYMAIDEQYRNSTFETYIKSLKVPILKLRTRVPYDDIESFMSQKPEFRISAERFRYTREAKFFQSNNFRLKNPPRDFEAACLDSPEKFKNCLILNFGETHSWDLLTSYELNQVYEFNWKKFYPESFVSYASMNTDYNSLQKAIEKQNTHSVMSNLISLWKNLSTKTVTKITVFKPTSVPPLATTTTGNSEVATKRRIPLTKVGGGASMVDRPAQLPFALNFPPPVTEEEIKAVNKIMLSRSLPEYDAEVRKYDLSVKKQKVVDETKVLLTTKKREKPLPVTTTKRQEAVPVTTAKNLEEEDDGFWIIQPPPSNPRGSPSNIVNLMDDDGEDDEERQNNMILFFEKELGATTPKEVWPVGGNSSNAMGYFGFVDKDGNPVGFGGALDESSNARHPYDRYFEE